MVSFTISIVASNIYVFLVPYKLTTTVTIKSSLTMAFVIIMDGTFIITSNGKCLTMVHVPNTLVLMVIYPQQVAMNQHQRQQILPHQPPTRLLDVLMKMVKHILMVPFGIKTIALASVATWEI